jgi:SAM-dependent methyltransferase
MNGANDAGYQAMYEGFYARAGSNFQAIPWAALAPHHSLVAWLDGRPPVPAGRALVVGCGLGDDAEYVAGRGRAVTAFDFSPTAIERCRERFPASPVDYVVADLFSPPGWWRGAFDLVVEIRTLQSMPAEVRPPAVAMLAALVAPTGALFVHGFGAADGESFDGPPWPVTPSQLARLADAGLHRVEHSEEPASRRAVSFTSVYRRPETAPAG